MGKLVCGRFTDLSSVSIPKLVVNATPGVELRAICLLSFGVFVTVIARDLSTTFQSPYPYNSLDTTQCCSKLLQLYLTCSHFFHLPQLRSYNHRI